MSGMIEAPGDAHRHRGADALRDQQQAGVQRVLAADGLEVQGQQQHRAGERGADHGGRAEAAGRGGARVRVTSPRRRRVIGCRP
jgi:hypothetical protein